MVLCFQFSFSNFLIGFFRYEVAENFSDDDDDKAVIAELRNDIVNRQKTHKSIIEVRF